jgi:hypothetical protein
MVLNKNARPYSATRHYREDCSCPGGGQKNEEARKPVTKRGYPHVPHDQGYTYNGRRGVPQMIL